MHSLKIKNGFFMRFFVAFLLCITLSAYGAEDKTFLGFWKAQGDLFRYLKIEKNGEHYLLTWYRSSLLNGSFERIEYSVAIKNNTLTSIGEVNSSPTTVSFTYKESDHTLLLDGGPVFAKVDDADARKLIEAREREADAECKILLTMYATARSPNAEQGLNVDIQGLGGSQAEDALNAYIKSLGLSKADKELNAYIESLGVRLAFCWPIWSKHGWLKNTRW
ncbi:TPA: hypothetical protein RQN76_003867 [Aeromonas dhakensis]|nr:hypothetical protein [Aeromonas dhakensis]